MLHGQDYLTQPGSRCNWDSQCIYEFPQHMQPSMMIDEHGRMNWCQREEEDIWVMPYCPALLSFADCHFHFDVVYTAKVFSYLYKYLYKGPDTAHFIIKEDIENEELVALNEICDYQKKGTYQHQKLLGISSALRSLEKNPQSWTFPSTSLNEISLNFANKEERDHPPLFWTVILCECMNFMNFITKNTSSSSYSTHTLQKMSSHPMIILRE